MMVRMSKLCIGIDLGGTFIKLAAVAPDADGWDVRAQSQVPTPDTTADDVVAAMADGARALMAEAGFVAGDVLGVGIGAPGPLDRDEGIIVNAPNLPGMTDFPMRDRVANALGLPAALENDANAAALGEFLLGAGREVESLVMITLGTGVGGGIILDGHIWHGSRDFAGEVGHMIVQPDGLPCNCGQRGCLEQYASATFLAKRATDALHNAGTPHARHDAGTPHAAEAGPPAEIVRGKGQIDAARKAEAGPLAEILREKGQIDAADVNAARKAGDALAARIWDDAVRYLAIAAVNLQRLI